MLTFFSLFYIIHFFIKYFIHKSLKYFLIIAFSNCGYDVDYMLALNKNLGISMQLEDRTVIFYHVNIVLHSVAAAAAAALIFFFA